MTTHELIARFKAANLHFTLTTVRDNAVMFQVAVPGQRWEVEVFADGSIEFERFVSDADVVADESQLLKLIDQFKD